MIHPGNFLADVFIVHVPERNMSQGEVMEEFGRGKL
jgi:hypothetical protein